MNDDVGLVCASFRWRPWSADDEGGDGSGLIAVGPKIYVWPWQARTAAAMKWRYFTVPERASRRHGTRRSAFCSHILTSRAIAAGSDERPLNALDSCMGTANHTQISHNC